MDAASARAPMLTAATFALLFFSTLIPIWAAAMPGEPTLAHGIIDVSLAALLFALLIALHYRAKHAITVEVRAKSYEICRWLAAVPLLLFVLYGMGLKLKWDVLLIGLGWRSWYLVIVLPLALAARGRDS